MVPWLAPKGKTMIPNTDGFSPSVHETVRIDLWIRFRGSDILGELGSSRDGNSMISTHMIGTTGSAELHSHAQHKGLHSTTGMSIICPKVMMYTESSQDLCLVLSTQALHAWCKGRRSFSPVGWCPSSMCRAAYLGSGRGCAEAPSLS